MSASKTLLKQKQSDLLGVLASGLCAIHCAVTPLFFMAKPFMHSSVDFHSHGNGLWAMLDYVFLVLCLVAVWFSSKHTTHKTIKWVFWSAWFIFSTGLLSELLKFHHSIWLMYAGSATLIIAHIINYRFCKTCRIENNEHHD